MTNDLNREGVLRELDRAAAWVLLSAVEILIAWWVGLIHWSTEFYVLLGIAVFIAAGRQRSMFTPVARPWFRVRIFISEVITTFLVAGLLWRAGLWIVHRFTH